MTRCELPLLLLAVLLITLLPSYILAWPQDLFFAPLPQDEEAPAAPALNNLSDLSAGLNLVPVGSLITAAANAVPPAPVQFIRVAMNSGL
ncbi:uncharacterized protein LOC108606252 [Drosophila busckii]|uniref:uncharacterized protein LOC108606252 n=1 Tax=Drosophila busckii TaxID=30019 RepID=UPI00083ECEA6|nr:uncharacterized protein LOC108606252 [Drosophila busckii]